MYWSIRRIKRIVNNKRAARQLWPTLIFLSFCLTYSFNIKIIILSNDIIKTHIFTESTFLRNPLTHVSIPWVASCRNGGSRTHKCQHSTYCQCSFIWVWHEFSTQPISTRQVDEFGCFSVGNGGTVNCFLGRRMIDI